MKNVLDLIKEDMISPKYKNADDVMDMVITQETDTLLNPAYNKEYSKFLDTLKEDFKKDIKLNFSESYGLDTPLEFIGTGGVGANLLYMLEHHRNFTEDNNGEKFYIPNSFFEFDHWDFSNLARIPFIPEKYRKGEDIVAKELANHDAKEEQFLDPLFIEASHNKLSKIIPCGAMDLETRKVMTTAKIPYITVTHKDDKLQIKLCPTPVEHESLMAETYGMIDVNFLLPAVHLASFYISDIMNAANTDKTEGYNISAVKAYEDIKVFKAEMLKYRELTIANEANSNNDILQSFILYCADIVKDRTNYNLEDTDELQKFRVEIYTEVTRRLSNAEDLEAMVNSSKESFNHLGGKEYVCTRAKELLDLDTLWSGMEDRVLLEITPDDVRDFLEVKNTKEAYELVRRLSSNN